MAVHRFGKFLLDVDTRQLLSDGTPVHVSPKAFQLLQILVEAAPRALSKAELQERLWPQTFVVEANLHHLVAEIRAALADTSRRPQFVRTVHGFGYAFQSALLEGERRQAASRVCVLRWDGGRARLGAGAHVIGRDPSADVVLDFSSVSRRHARIVVGAAAVMLEDAGSKNGTFAGGQRLSAAVELTDGHEITIGMVPVSVRVLTEATSTETAILNAEPGA